MRIYLASRYGRKEELRGYREALVGMGHTVTSTWLNEGEESSYTDADLIECAERDIREINDSDTFVCFTEDRDCVIPGAARGGRHFECGVAFKNFPMMLVLVGPRENIFYLLQAFHQFDTFDQFLATLTPI